MIARHAHSLQELLFILFYVYPEPVLHIEKASMSGPSPSHVVIHPQRQLTHPQEKHNRSTKNLRYTATRLTATSMLNLLREAIVISHRTNGYGGHRVS